ncbi:hypothetical protein SY88_11705 [Clostridiales bacterium PH28_bin88]|nr:hypothetical protein SY88_11705 [Clostridiales bacterium PH28_bin88]
MDEIAIAKKYFETGIKKATRVEARPDYTLVVEFNNGEIRKYHMKDKLYGVFEPLKDWNKFKRVFISKGNGAITWELDGRILDICPDSIYLKGSDGAWHS